MNEIRQWLGRYTSEEFVRAHWDRLTRHLELRPALEGIPYWTAAGLVGLTAVAYSSAFTACIDMARGIADRYPMALFVLSPCCLIVAAALVEKFAPFAGGTGIPRVIEAISMDSTTQCREISERLNLRVALIVILSSLFAVLGAGALGREGPMVHIGACLFYVVGRQFQRTGRPKDDHRPWIVAGGAAGVAAAFNAPLAGVVFVLEELAQQHFHKFKTAVITAAIIAGIVSQWLTGRYLFFGYPRVGEVAISSVPWALGLGILCGLFAVPFHRMLRPDFQSRFKAFFRTQTRFAFFAGISVAAIAVFIDHGTIGGGVANIQELLFKDGAQASWGLIFGRYVATFLSHLSGCAGGFLAPSLALGATLGSKFAALTNYPSPNLLVMVGMAAFLSAIVRAPFTAWVIVMEMTDRHSAIFPLMVAALVSSGTVAFIQDRLGPGKIKP